MTHYIVQGTTTMGEVIMTAMRKIQASPYVIGSDKYYPVDLELYGAQPESPQYTVLHFAHPVGPVNDTAERVRGIICSLQDLHLALSQCSAILQCFPPRRATLTIGLQEITFRGDTSEDTVRLVTDAFLALTSRFIEYERELYIDAVRAQTGQLS